MPNTFLNTGRTVAATSNPVNNVNQVSNNPVNQVQTTTLAQNTQPQAQQAINPITIPIQLQPQVVSAAPTQTQPAQTRQATQNTAPTPQTYNANNTNSNVVDFNQIYSSYQSQYGNNNQSTNNNVGSSGIKKTSMGSTIVTPTVTNIDSVQGQYQSAYSDTINSLISEMLTQVSTGFQYDPTTDSALQMATEYAANSTLQSLAGSGVLNSSATAERVARVVSELIPQYEQLAYNRWTDSLGQLADTAQLVMNYDSQQFEYWKDAKDREFQEKQFEYQKKQDEIENAWKRVDELGYVDNEASAILGVPVGTLSGEARLAKEQQEFELAKMREQLEIEKANDEALYKLKAELDKDYASYELQLNKQYADYTNRLDRENMKYENELNRENMQYQNQLDRENTAYEYQLAAKYGTSSSGSSSRGNYTSLSTYEDIIDSRWITRDDITGQTSMGNNNDTIWNYIRGENEAGRMSDNTAYALIDKYGLTNPGSVSVSQSGNTLLVKKGGQYYTLTLTDNATRDQILRWGNNIGVDLSNYV